VACLALGTLGVSSESRFRVETSPALVAEPEAELLPLLRTEVGEMKSGFWQRLGEVQGVFKARTKQMPMTALIPGLPVEVKGTLNAQNQLVADTVKFKGSDLKAAMDAQAGLQPTAQKVAANAAQIQQSEQDIAAQKAALQQQQAELTA
jgi:hypothetical protein